MSVPQSIASIISSATMSVPALFPVPPCYCQRHCQCHSASCTTYKISISVSVPMTVPGTVSIGLFLCQWSVVGAGVCAGAGNDVFSLHIGISTFLVSNCIWRFLQFFLLLQFLCCRMQMSSLIWPGPLGTFNPGPMHPILPYFTIFASPFSKPLSSPPPSFFLLFPLFTTSPSSPLPTRLPLSILFPSLRFNHSYHSSSLPTLRPFLPLHLFLPLPLHLRRFDLGSIWTGKNGFAHFFVFAKIFDRKARKSGVRVVVDYVDTSFQLFKLLLLDV